MKHVFKNGLILLVCAAILALGLSALLLPCHHCVGEGCALCLTIGRAMQLAGLAAVSGAFVARLFASRPRREREQRGARQHAFSLVGIKAELLI